MAERFASLTPADALAVQKNYMSTIGTNRPELIEPAARLQARSDPKAVAAWLREVLTTDLHRTSAGSRSRCSGSCPYDPARREPPTGPHAGADARVLRVAGRRRAKATVVAITPARHFVMLDQPELFYKAVSEFMASIQR